MLLMAKPICISAVVKCRRKCEHIVSGISSCRLLIVIIVKNIIYIKRSIFKFPQPNEWITVEYSVVTGKCRAVISLSGPNLAANEYQRMCNILRRVSGANYKRKGQAVPKVMLTE